MEDYFLAIAFTCGTKNTLLMNYQTISDYIEAVITAKCGDVTAICKVSVIEDIPEEILISQIILDPDAIQVTQEESIQIKATILPEDATDKTILWSSTDESVAVVDENGLVKILGFGSAEIIAIAADNSGVSAKCHIEYISGIGSLFTEGTRGDVYTLGGILLRKNADTCYVSSLAGTYIVKIAGKSYKIVK